MYKHAKSLFSVVFLAMMAVGLLGFNQTAFAQATPGEEIVKQLQAGADTANLPSPRDPRIVAGDIIRVALGLLGIIFVAIIVYAGFVWMTAGGNEENAGKAKKLIFNGVIGLVIVLSAYAITIFAFRLGLSSYGDQCSTSSQCMKDQKCNLYGMCVDSYWCQTTNDCKNLGRNYECRNNGCTTAQDLGDYFTD